MTEREMKSIIGNFLKKVLVPATLGTGMVFSMGACGEQEETGQPDPMAIEDESESKGDISGGIVALYAASMPKKCISEVTGKERTEGTRCFNFNDWCMGRLLLPSDTDNNDDSTIDPGPVAKYMAPVATSSADVVAKYMAPLPDDGVVAKYMAPVPTSDAGVVAKYMAPVPTSDAGVVAKYMAPVPTCECVCDSSSGGGFHVLYATPMPEVK